MQEDTYILIKGIHFLRGKTGEDTNGVKFDPSRLLADGNSKINYAVEESVLELDPLGMSHVLHTEQVEAISILARSAKNGSVGLHNFYLMPKCCLIQYVFFYVLTEQMSF